MELIFNYTMAALVLSLIVAPIPKESLERMGKKALQVRDAIFLGLQVIPLVTGGQLLSEHFNGTWEPSTLIAGIYFTLAILVTFCITIRYCPFGKERTQLQAKIVGRTWVMLMIVPVSQFCFGLLALLYPIQ